MDKSGETTESITISRRRLLQLLAASGVAVGLERLLPGKWETPIAEASPDQPNPEIGDLYLFWQPVNASYYRGTARFRYRDEAGDILSNSPLYAVGSEQGVIANGQPVTEIGGRYIPYNSTVGTMRFPLPLPSLENISQGFKIQIAAAGDLNRSSNIIADTFVPGNYGVLNISNMSFVE